MDKLDRDNIRAGHACPHCGNAYSAPRCCGACLSETEAECLLCACGAPATGRAGRGQVYGYRPESARGQYEITCAECA